jgi:hypothetical protein
MLRAPFLRYLRLCGDGLLSILWSGALKDTIFAGKSKWINFIPPTPTNPLFKMLPNAYIPLEIRTQIRGMHHRHFIQLRIANETRHNRIGKIRKNYGIQRINQENR